MGYMQGFILILLYAYILLGVFMHFIAYKKKQKNSLFEVGPSVPSPTKETKQQSVHAAFIWMLACKRGPAPPAILYKVY